jgi:deazaflavin-dependent oxidoreductase (nitroreductase family)
MNAVQKAFVAAHRMVYQVSKGKVASKFGDAPMLLLTTTGNKTGQPRTHPLLYLQDGDALAVIASAGGQPSDPAWFRNLVANPAVTVQIGAEHTPMRARVASPEERERLWPKAVAAYKSYASYQTKTSREIPVVILEK